MLRLLIMADARSVHTERWCRFFVEEGFDVALFSLEPSVFETKARFYQGHRPTGSGIIDYSLARRDFRKTLTMFRPDIVNAHYVASYGWLASYCRDIPVVVTAWGSDLLQLPRKSLLHRRRIARALKRADRCTVDSDNLFEAAARFIPADKIVRIVMGVLRDVFDTLGKNEYPSSGIMRIIAPRGLQKVYDPQTIIEAAALLRRRLEMHIDLSDLGGRTDVVRRIIERQALSDTVTLRPFIPGHEAYLRSLRQYDIFLSASRSDSTSVALLEAMAAGLFPVVSRIPGNEEWITSGHNGLLFEPGSAASLAEALVQAEAMRTRFAATAAENRRRIENDALWEENMARAKHLFLQLAGQ